MSDSNAPATEASEMARDGGQRPTVEPSSTQHTSADVAPELFEP